MFTAKLPLATMRPCCGMQIHDRRYDRRHGRYPAWSVSFVLVSAVAAVAADEVMPMWCGWAVWSVSGNKKPRCRYSGESRAFIFLLVSRRRMA
ncbi:hypothetical protein [Citrobacter freundii]|uniref:hypothetical protein n=1 Tax=Citrobacter freundii TaxID=546 RepID=UPI0018FE8B32|nr:hypothetical protein [Citrobacter freundii]